MEDESKESEAENLNEFEEKEQRANILSLMRDIIERESKRNEPVDIFDENIACVFPTFWAKESQIATCRQCGKTGDSVVKKRCGFGNVCCGCCFFLLCLWGCIPCLCCLTCDIQHYCPSCHERMGRHTLI